MNAENKEVVITDSNQSKNIKWVLYVVIVLFSTIIFSALYFFLSSFDFLNSLVLQYIIIAIVSIILGLISALILNKIVESNNKTFLIGCSIMSFLSAFLISIYLTVTSKLREKFLELSNEESQGVNAVQTLITPHEWPNAILTGILIILFFNIVPVLVFSRNEQKNIKDLRVYIYCAFIYLILYLIINYFIINLLFSPIIY